MGAVAVDGAQLAHPLPVLLRLMAQLAGDIHDDPGIATLRGDGEDGMKGLHTGVSFSSMLRDQFLYRLRTHQLHGVVGGAAYNLAHRARVDGEGAGDVDTGAAASRHAQRNVEALGFVCGARAEPGRRSGSGLVGYGSQRGSGGNGRSARHALLAMPAEGGLVQAAIVCRQRPKRPPSL